MSKSKIISLIAAALIIGVGGIYLSVGAAAIPFALASCIILLCVMGGAGIAEARASKEKGLAALLPAICFFVLAGFIAAALVYYCIM